MENKNLYKSSVCKHFPPKDFPQMKNTEIAVRNGHDVT